MNEFDSLKEKSWRRKLTAAEEASLRAWLADHPEARADWEMDRHLTEALEKLPDAPVSSNFTARVLQAIERESVAVQRPSRNRFGWFLRSLMPKAALAAVVLGTGILTYHEHATAKRAERAELVQGVQMVAGVSSLPSPEILQDFDTIHQINSSPGPDAELIALMK